MKYLVVTDIHGSSESARIIIDKFNSLKCDKIVILGDILYHGPRNDLPANYNPKEVIKVLNSLAEKIIAVRGNCDAEVDQMVLNFEINENEIIDDKYFCTHGHHINYEKPISMKEGSVVVHGHTHIIRKDIVNGVAYINVGSITIPKNNTARCYGIIDDAGIHIYDLADNLLLKHSISE